MLLKIDYELCGGCGVCIEVCHAAVFKWKEDKPWIVNADSCTYCDTCVKSCPDEAITLLPVDERLDLRGEICPYNFVKTKLKLEEIEKGQVLEVIIDDGEPIMNVPRGVKEEGHEILRVTKFKGAFKLLIKKR